MIVHWKPQLKQEQALLRDEDEVLFGGARGGGKTDAGQVWLIEPKYINHPKYRGLVIRRNADDLKDWIDRAQEMYKPLNAVFSGQPSEISFPSGAKIRTGHLKDDKAYTKYQGHEYQKILVEELTHIPRESDFEKLLGSNRSTIKELPAKFFGTTNPDGDGFYWVKKRFRIPDYPTDIINFTEKGMTRCFVPSRIEDNKFLFEDFKYKNFLENLSDETLRKQWREGCWEEPNIEGAYYAKYIEKARIEGRIIKVPVDNSMPVYTFWDLGMDDAMCIWFAQFNGFEVRLIDYYENEGEGLEFYKNILSSKGYGYGGHFLPHDAEVRELGTGVSRKEKAESLGITPITIVTKLDIADGIEAVRTVLSRCYFDEERCVDGINALRSYTKEYDEKRDVYRARPVHNWASHGADAFRYLAVGYGSILNNNNSNILMTSKVYQNRTKERSLN